MHRVLTSPFKTFVVLLTAVAWFAVSNHCALAVTVFSPQPGAVSICDACHNNGKKSDTGKSPVSGEVACCKVLKATAADVKSNSIPKPLPAGVVDYAIVAGIDFQISKVLLAPAMPTGPPEARSFTEVVLNRSLLAHAPPVSVA